MLAVNEYKALNVKRCPANEKNHNNHLKNKKIDMNLNPLISGKIITINIRTIFRLDFNCLVSTATEFFPNRPFICCSSRAFSWIAMQLYITIKINNGMIKNATVSA